MFAFTFQPIPLKLLSPPQFYRLKYLKVNNTQHWKGFSRLCAAPFQLVFHLTIFGMDVTVNGSLFSKCVNHSMAKLFLITFHSINLICCSHKYRSFGVLLSYTHTKRKNSRLRWLRLVIKFHLQRNNSSISCTGV